MSKRFPCPNCRSSFWTWEELKLHSKRNKFHPCITCATEFESIKDLEKHIVDTHHKMLPKESSLAENLQFYLEKAYYLQKVIVSREDRKKSRVIVQAYIEQILGNIKRQKGGELYSRKIIPAGSTATQTKIIKADEFDYNIVLTEPFVDYAKFEGDKMKYKLQGSGPKSLDKHLKIQNNIQVFDEIPNGFIVALHKNNAKRNITKHSHCQEVIPRWIQEDLYKKIEVALKEEKLTKYISLNSSPHGPAVTLYIKDPAKVSHVISVDFSASIDINFIDVSAYGWPRKQTKKVLTESQIEHVKEAGLHLVPKKDLFWYISYSKAARALMNTLDGSDDCRKICHQILKKDFEVWKSQSKTGMHGISTYIFKHHLFWMNEDEKFQKTDYWRDQNIGKCYMDMLSDLASKLRAGVLMNYFKHKTENILEGKRQDVLEELATRLLERKEQLQHIKFT